MTLTTYKKLGRGRTAKSATPAEKHHKADREESKCSRKASKYRMRSKTATRQCTKVTHDSRPEVRRAAQSWRERPAINRVPHQQAPKCCSEQEERGRQAAEGNLGRATDKCRTRKTKSHKNCARVGTRMGACMEHARAWPNSGQRNKNKWEHARRHAKGSAAKDLR
jgi:hypothetical protein